MATQTPNAELHELYQQLMTSNQNAFALEQYNIAYHALMAASHCAETLKDAHGLQEVKQRAGRIPPALIPVTYLSFSPVYSPSCSSAAPFGRMSVHVSVPLRWPKLPMTPSFIPEIKV